MQSFDDFKQHITSKIKEIDAEYKRVYETYEPSENEEKLIAFLDDIWEIRFENEALNDSHKNASIQLSFIDKDNSNNFLDRNFRLSKLHPKQKKTTPLYFLISRLSASRDYHFFLCPNIYTRSKNHYQNWEQYISASNCYFVDIDEIRTEKPVYNCTEEEILQYLYNEYPLLMDCHPSYILMSGGGLHLYFILEHTEYLFGNRYKNNARGMHRTLTSDLIKLLGADPACKNLNRLLRTPFSVNMKYPIKTRLYCYEEYHRTYRYTSLKDFVAALLPINDPLTRILEAEATKPAKAPTTPKPQAPRSFNTTAEYRSLIATNARKTLFENRQADLEIWFFRHLKDMDGYRHKFFLIYSIVLKELHSQTSYIENQCYKLNNMLDAPLPDSELERTISSKRIYHFKNETIADWLNFTPSEIATMKCHYGADAIAEYHRERGVYYNELAKETRHQKQEAKEAHIFQIIADNPDISLSKLAKLLDCHKSTAFRWKRKYEESR